MTKIEILKNIQKKENECKQNLNQNDIEIKENRSIVDDFLDEIDKITSKK